MNNDVTLMTLLSKVKMNHAKLGSGVSKCRLINYHCAPDMQ